MATIVLESNQAGKGKGKSNGAAIVASQNVTVSANPGRYHYATVNGKARTFERVGTDASGNAVYRDQNRRG